MKRTILLIIGLVIFVETYAQEKSNSWFFEPNLYTGYTTTKLDNGSHIEMDVIALGLGSRMGKYLTDNLNIGLDLALIKEFETKSHSNFSSAVNTQSAIVNAEYYMLNKNKFRLSCDLGIGVVNKDVHYGAYSGNTVKGILPINVTLWMDASVGFSLGYIPSIVTLSERPDDNGIPCNMVYMKFRMKLNNCR